VGDVVFGEAAEGGDEAVELVEPAGALAVGGEVDGAAVDAGFDAPLGVGDEGGLLGDGASIRRGGWTGAESAALLSNFPKKPKQPHHHGCIPLAIRLEPLPQPCPFFFAQLL